MLYSFDKLIIFAVIGIVNINSVIKLNKSILRRLDTNAFIAYAARRIIHSRSELYSSLKTVFLADSITGVGQRAFSECNNLTSVDLSPNITTIGIRAFENCSSLSRIELPSGITVLEEGMFENCLSLYSISIHAKRKIEPAQEQNTMPGQCFFSSSVPPA